MPMKVKLLSEVEDLGGKGSTHELDDEQANALVSAGLAQQVNPFQVTEHHTSGPPWSPEKLGPEARRLTEQAKDLTAQGKEAGDPGPQGGPVDPEAASKTPSQREAGSGEDETGKRRAGGR